MPAFKWEIELAEKEGVHIHPSLSAQQYTSRDGRLGGITFKRVTSTSIDAEGRIHWTLMAGSGSDYAVDADAAVVAIGQGPDTAGLLAESGKTNILAIKKRSLQTNVPGVFTAGDVSATGGTISEAMAAGRKAASFIEQYLNGMPVEEVKESKAKETIRIRPEQVPNFFIRKQRWEMPRLLPKEATKSFMEVDLGYRDWQAVEEARRCLNCRMCANCIFERGQLCFDTGHRLL